MALLVSYVVVGLVVVISSVDAKLDKYCPHPQSPPYYGICDGRLVRTIKLICTARGLKFNFHPTNQALLLRTGVNRSNRSASMQNALLQLQPFDDGEAVSTVTAAPTTSEPESSEESSTETTGSPSPLPSTTTVLADLLLGLPTMSSKEEALALVRSRRQAAASNWPPYNVICECCYSACTQQELLSYCSK